MPITLNRFVTVLGLFIALSGCNSKKESSEAASAGKVKVGLVLEKSGKDDKSFNAAAYAGATKAAQEFSQIELKVVESPDTTSFESLQRALSEKKYDLIIAVGFLQGEAISKNAAKFPDQKYAIVDSEVNAPNVRSLMFEEHEGSFVVGAIAAKQTAAKKVGFIGGMDIPLIRRFEKGFTAGVKFIDPKKEVIVNYIGVTTEAWNNPPKAKEMGVAQYKQGADVIFVAAGNSGTGVFDAAEELKKLAIGVDSNQNWIKPGFVLTSMLKRVDLAVYEAIKDVINQKYTGGVVRFGLENHGVDFAIDENNEKILSPESRKAAEDAKAAILNKKVVVPDYYKMKQ